MFMSSMDLEAAIGLFEEYSQYAMLRIKFIYLSILAKLRIITFLFAVYMMFHNQYSVHDASFAIGTKLFKFLTSVIFLLENKIMAFANEFVGSNALNIS